MRDFFKKVNFAGTLIVFFSVCLVASGLVLSCSEDNSSIDEPDNPGDEVEIPCTNENDEFVLNLMKGQEDATIEDIISELRKSDKVKSVECSDSILTILMADGDVVMAAPYMEWKQSSDDVENWVNPDEETVDSILDFFNEFDDVSSEISALKSTDLISESRAASSTNMRKLMKGRVAIFNPWHHYPYDKDYNKGFSYDNISLAAQCKERKYRLKELTVLPDGPNAFDSFGYYDMVVVSGHGTKKGQLQIPWALHSIYQKPYVKGGVIDKTAMNEAGIRVMILGTGRNSHNGLFLEKPFFDNAFKGGKLRNTVLFGAFCYSARYCSHFALSAYNVGNCAELYGSLQACTTDIANEFNRIIGNLAMGVSSYVALTDRLEGYLDVKTFDGFFTIIRWSQLHKPDVLRGAIRPANTPTKVRKSTKKNNRYLLGGRVVYDPRALPHKSGQTSGTRSGADDGLYLRLTDLDENQSVEIAVTAESVEGYDVTQLSRGVSLANFDIAIDDLKPLTNYSYETFFRYEGYTLSTGVVRTFKTEDENLEIRTAEEFREFRDRMMNGETFKGKTIRLMNDIDLGDMASWTYWYDSNTFYDKHNAPAVDQLDMPAFAGTFEGGNHTLRSTSTPTGQGRNGDLLNSLFYKNKGVIRDLNFIFKGVTNVSDDRVLFTDNGGICIYNTHLGKIENCMVDMTLSGDCHSTLICYYNDGLIDNCTGRGKISGFYDCGGLAYLNFGGAIISNCTTYQNVSLNQAYFGLICYSNYGTIEYCKNYGSGTDMVNCNYGQIISCDNYGDCSEQGIFQYNGGVVRDCTNYGNVGYGGIGHQNYGIINGCVNRGNVLSYGVCVGNHGKILNSMNYGTLQEECNHTDEELEFRPWHKAHFFVGICWNDEKGEVSGSFNFGGFIVPRHKHYWFGDILTHEIEEEVWNRKD